MKNFKNLISFVAIGFMPYLINLFMLPIYSSFFTEGDFGVIGLAMAFLFISSSWSNLQLPGAISRIYFDYKDDDLINLISTLINSSVIVCILFCTLYLLMADTLVYFIYEGEEYYWLHITVVLSVFLSCTNTAFEKLMIIQQRGSALLARTVFSQIFSVASGVYFVCYQQLGALGFMLSQTVYYTIVFLFSFAMNKNLYRMTLKKEYFIEGLRYSYPLIFHALGGVVFMYSSAFFIKGVLNISMLGVYTVADRFSQIPKAVVASFNNVYSPVYNKVRLAKKSTSELCCNAQIFWSVLFGVFSAHFIYLSRFYIEKYMVGDFNGVFSVLLILVPAYFFRSLFCFSSMPIFYHKDTKFIPVITCVSGVIVLSLSYFVILLLGIVGAAVMVATGFILTFVLAEYFTRRKYGESVFRTYYMCIYVVTFLLSGLLISIVDVESFFILVISSFFISLGTLLSFYWLNVFMFRNSIDYLRKMND